MVIGVPTFLDVPEAAWVKCSGARELAGDEIACTVTGVNQIKVVITNARYFDKVAERLHGLVVGEFSANRLVDFPSGDRLLVAPELVEAANGHTV